jgi:hypothetical protein
MQAGEPNSPNFGKSSDVNGAKPLELTRHAARSSRLGRFQEFWALMSRCESLTAQEAGCLKAGQYEEIERLQDEKAAVFASLQVVGRGLGIDRSNRDLRQRLEALAEAEKRNLLQFNVVLDLLRSELRAGDAIERNLHSLRGAYSPEDVRGEFFVEG